MNSHETQYGNEWDTNTGWWVEKPGRAERPSQFSGLQGSRYEAPTVWRNAALVVALVFSLIIALISLTLR